MWRAAWIASLAAGLLPAQVFEGLVRDSVTGQPVPKASIQLMRGEKQPAYSGTTKPDGTFRFEEIAPGDYRIDIRRPGYADAALVSRFTAGKDVTGAAIDLEPWASVTGRVTDADGDPVPGAQVLVIDRPGATTETGAHGEYRLRSVAGRYSIAAHPSDYSVFAEEPGGPEMRSVDVIHPPLDLGPGQHIDGIDFRLPTVVTYHVRGWLRPYPTPQENLFVIARIRNGGRSPGARSGPVHKDGSFEVVGMPPGSYSLEIYPHLSSRPSGKTAVDVADRDVNGVTLPAIQPFDLKGRARFEDDAVPQSFDGVKLHLESLDPFPFASSGSDASLEPDGTFQFRNVRVGEFAVTLASQSDIYLKSGNRIDLSNGPSGEMEIVLGTGTGEIEGNLDRSGVLLPAATAVLLPAEGPARVRTSEIDVSGRFRFRFVPPGKYFVFASTRLDREPWNDMSFVEQMKEQGVAVDVPKKGTAHAAVKILATDAVARAIGLAGQ